MDPRRQSPDKSRHAHVDVAWKYSYPRVNGEVRNIAVERFLVGLANQKKSSEDATLHDIQRGYTINGTLYDTTTLPTVRELRAELNQFIGLARKYNPEDQKILCDYLASHGGQQNNWIINELIRANHFTDAPLQGSGSVHQNLIDSNWQINNDGKIEFSYCVEILDLEAFCPEYPDPISLADNGEGVLTTYRLHDSIEDTEKFLILKKNGLRPLMRIEMKLELDVRDGTVIPIVRDIDVTGYNKSFYVHEEAFIDQRDRRAYHFSHLLRMIDDHIINFGEDVNIQRQFMRLRKLILACNYGENIEPLRLALLYLSRIHYTTKGVLFLKDKSEPVVALLRKDKEFSRRFESQFGRDFASTLTRENLSEELARYGIGDEGYVTNDMYDKDEISTGFGTTCLLMQSLMNTYRPAHTAHIPLEAINIQWSKMVDRSKTTEESCFNHLRKGHYVINSIHLNHTSSDYKISGNIHQLAIMASSDIDEQHAFNSWISTHGSMECEALIEILINSHQFDIDLPAQLRQHQNALLFKPHYDRPAHTWELSADGSPQLTSVYYVDSLFCEDIGMAIVRKTSNDQLLFLKARHQVANSKQPLMRVETKISLSIVDGRVVPAVTAVKVDSYSRNLTPLKPEQDITHQIKL